MSAIHDDARRWHDIAAENARLREQLARARQTLSTMAGAISRCGDYEAERQAMAAWRKWSDEDRATRARTRGEG